MHPIKVDATPTVVPAQMCRAKRNMIQAMQTGYGEGVISLTFEQLADAAELDLATDRQKFMAYLYGSRCHILREDGLWWMLVKDEDRAKVATPAELLSIGKATTRCIVRKSKRGCRQIGTIDLAALGDEQKTETLALAAQLGTLAQFANGKAMRKLVARNIMKPIDMTKLLSAMVE